ncbi:MAG: CRISPR-associated protein Csx19 [Aeromicrobium sp.]|uniref:type III-D CRISPR-associated protein Csx19 n=1 Tax=Aeromicrobium sp. TaxID=1871063 RepID=UPI0039E4051C
MTTDTRGSLQPGSLHDALATVPDGAVGYVLSPRAARWFRKVSGELSWHDDKATIPLSTVYALEAFDGTTSVSWERDSGGQGFRRTLTRPKGSARVRAHLWGTITTVDPGWVHLSEDRVADFWVPLTGLDSKSKGRSVRLVYAEHWTEDDHGNTYVKATQPLQIEVC